ncbi:MAG TPA: AMP-binding protein [Longimicrobium sp.]|jgi:amino acid adenylation domain-containing protein|uniref:AMP-binding protein n=1 Tax=Longimicrobium sp. TaxID=2029185 RepID=UPI002ED8C249
MSNTIAKEFDQAAERHAGRTAVESGEGALTFAALAEQAGRVAAALGEAGGGAGRVVGIWLPAGADYIASVVAVLRHDAVFLPLDTAWPEGRLQRVLEEARPEVVITDAVKPGQTAALCAAAGIPGTAILSVGGAAGACRLERPGSPAAPPRELPPRACYLVYTSGSTGRPKGILGRDDSVAQFLAWERAEYALDVSARVPFLAPVSVDVSLRDVFAALLSGGTVCIPPDEARANPVLLAEWLGRARINHVHLVPSLLRLLVREAGDALAASGATAHVRELLVAGEPLYGRDVRAVRRVFGERVGITNLYGPSETTMVKCFFRVPTDPGPDDEIVPLGAPMPGTRILVRDGDRDLAAGEAGEVVIATAFGTCGYLGAGEPSGDRFIQVGDVSGASLPGFRTGDRGVLDGQGVLRYHGRMDDMLKVGGNRVELLELEATLRAAGVESAAVAPELAPDGDHRLHCFYVSPSTDAAAESRLQAHVRAYLPGYMHPASYTAVAALPTTVSGKLDRRALLELRKAPESGAGDGPADPLEAQVAGYWAEVLGLPEVPCDVAFQALGGSSLRAMQLISRIFRQHRIALNVRELMGRQTVRSLAALIRGRGVQTGAPRLAAGQPGQRHPLSPFQRLMWDVAQHAPAAPAYHEYLAVALNGAVDPELCRRVAEALVARHEILRTAFVEVDGAPVQEVRPPESCTPALLGVDVRAAADPEAAWRGHFLDQVDAPFDLGSPPLLRCFLYRVAEHRSVLACVFYHIIGDVFSVDVAFDEARALYAALRAGRPDALPPLERQYRHFAAETAATAEAARAEGTAFWTGYLPHPLPELRLSAAPRPFLKSFSGDSRHFDVPAGLVAELRATAAGRGVSPFVVALAAYARTFAEAAGGEPLVVGCPVLLRDRPDLESQLGLYLNTLPVRIDGAGTLDARALVRHVDESVMQALRFREYPVQHIAEDLALPLKPSRAPLYDTLFTLAESRALSSPASLALPRRQAKFDLSMILTAGDGVLRGMLEFNPGIVDVLAAEALVHGYQAALGKLCAELAGAAVPALAAAEP